MSLRIVGTEVVVVAEPGRFAGHATFGQGLSFIRAENNMGKTTLVTSILYALGLEGMLGPGHDPPLKPAVTTSIADDEGTQFPVIESWVMTEIENAAGDRMTLKRSVVGAANRKLVSTWDGAALTDPGGDYTARDYFVRVDGGAQREAGLHHRLAQFIGWDLPRVTGFSGQSLPLYMEILAPMLFVEQTRGWSGIAAVMPRYLQIRHPERRAVEFLSGLSALTRARDRELLNHQIGEVKADWRAAVRALEATIGDVGGTVDGLPADPAADWPPSPPVQVKVLLDEAWTPVALAIRRLREQLHEASRELPTAEAQASQAAAELTAEEERLRRLSAHLASANRDVAEQRGELAALDERIAAIIEDRDRYSDAIRLSNLGSLHTLAVADTRCPTCDQGLPHTLLGYTARPVMTLEDNKAMLDQERQTFQAMRKDAERVMHASGQRVVGLRREVSDARASVRALKATLTQNANAPSRAIIERQIRLEQRIEKLDAVADELVALDETLTPLAIRNRQLQADLKRIGGEGPTGEDKQRLDAFSASVRSQLVAYGFSSRSPNDVHIADDTYLPQVDGQPLVPKSISASDNVRLVWAYLTGLLELGRDFGTPHPGLVVYDEPGQQEISDASLAALFARLALTSGAGQQAIVATSKPHDELTALLGPTPAHRNDFTGHVLHRPA